MENSNVVTLMTFSSDGEAEIVKSILESSGIHCSLIHNTINSFLPYLSSGEDPIKLIVLESQVVLAQKILDAQFDQVEFDKDTL